ncbi:MAG: DnaJ domain-containing protein [Pseudomonadota bacterium]
MTEAEIKAFEEAARYGHKRTWRFGTGPAGGKKSAQMHDRRRWRGAEIFDEGTVGAPSSGAPRGRTRLQIRALNELDLEADATVDQIRERYSDYVRCFHPDSNKGDRSSEQKLARVLRAGKTLKAAGLMKR